MNKEYKQDIHGPADDISIHYKKVKATFQISVIFKSIAHIYKKDFS